MPRYEDVADPRIVKLMSHPLRLEILRHLEDHVASPTAMADLFGVPVGTASYHTRELHKLGMIELVRKAQRRGAIEHFYRAPTRIWFSDESWLKLPHIVRKAAFEASLAIVGAEVQAAAEAGGFDADDAYLTRQSLVLTASEWKQVSDTLLEARERINKIQSAAAKRAQSGDHADERQAKVVLMLFEAGPESEQSDTPAKLTRSRKARKRRASNKELEL